MLLLSNSALLLSKGGLVLIKGWLLLCYGYQTFNEIVMLVKLVKVKVGFRIVKSATIIINIYIYLIVSRNSVFHFQVWLWLLWLRYVFLSFCIFL